MNKTSLLDLWKITESELTQIVDENPSLRGFMLGYIGEYKLKNFLLSDSRVTSLIKPDDHKRGAGNKNDMMITYQNRVFSVEVKSLQTNSIKRLDNSRFIGTVQVDASDRRPVILPDGSQVETTCLLRGEFDLLALNLFQFRDEWDFAFILNRDLPATTSRKYTEYQQKYLLSTSVKIGLPLELPYEYDPFILLDRLIAESI